MAGPHPSTFTGPAWAGPSGTEPPKTLADEIMVRILEVAWLPVGRGSDGMALLGVNIAVNCLREKPILKVEPRRFALLTEGGTTPIRARFSGSRDPALPSRYLPRGESVSGWLTFDVPKGSKGLLLISELTQPPAKLPLSVPAEP